MKRITKQTIAATILIGTTVFTVGGSSVVLSGSDIASKTETIIESAIAPEPIPTIEGLIIEGNITQIVEDPWTEDEVYFLTHTLAGECYEDKESDKRLVCEVILNRVSDGRFGIDVEEVVTSTTPAIQFCGYWNQSREVSESDIRIAEETLRDWYANDCKALSEYLYFTAGTNRENNFKTSE